MWEFFKPILVDFKNPIIFAIPFFLILIGIEVYINYKDRKENYVFKDSMASISMGLGSIFSDIISKSFAFIAFVWLYENYGLFKDELSWTVLGWVLLFFLDDFTFYWHHRLSHEVRVLWAAHVNHHSSEQYNLSTALRQSWTEIFYKYIFFLWLPFLGFHPLMVLTQISINLLFQFWVHTKYIKKLPSFIELIFNTPSHHRVHHASNIRYLDRNHAGTLIIWDRIFRTFAEEKDEEPVVYGITTNINTYNPLIIATHEFASLWNDIRKAPKFSDKLKYVFYPPGWSHDNSTQTARQMRAQLKTEK
jgi:sterol desaturase/sphingolipid hydroxylase (fatty acid hydroxylase superfamily)